MSLFRLKDLSIEQINYYLDEAERFKNGKVVNYNQQKIVGMLFFEPSTRTHYSFEAAALRLGCLTQNLDIANSSLTKGESLYDTVKFFEIIKTDVLVIRHPKNNYFEELKNINTPILNGGDGTGNHPSQSLLDLLTIKQEFKRFEGLRIAIIGDIKHSRVAHTNYEVMKRLGMEVYFSGPECFMEEGLPFIEFDKAIKEMDVIMLLRVQHERHKDLNKLSKKDKKDSLFYHQQFGLTIKRVNQMKEKAIILHPAPFNRNVEIADTVVECNKSRIFKQMENGLYIRQALLNEVLKDE